MPAPACLLLSSYRNSRLRDMVPPSQAALVQFNMTASDSESVADHVQRVIQNTKASVQGPPPTKTAPPNPNVYRRLSISKSGRGRDLRISQALLRLAMLSLLFCSHQLASEREADCLFCPLHLPMVHLSKLGLTHFILTRLSRGMCVCGMTRGPAMR